MRIAFVVPWFGWDIPGGAEAEFRELAEHLQSEDTEISILTTCVEKFASDWNKNHYMAGTHVERGVTIRRFKVSKRNTEKFDSINYKLMNNMLPLSDEEEETFVRENINSYDLYEYVREHKEEYDYFILGPYLYGTTYHVAQMVPEKTILIPCFHDEAYFYMRNFRKVYSNVCGVIYNAIPEKELTEKYYNLCGVRQIVMGIGMDVDIAGNPDRFREKYSINDAYILYAGRKDAGKNVHILLRYFAEYKRRNNTDLKLVLIGGGEIDIPKNIREDVYDLGFIPVQDKYDAYAAATVLCQPSSHESFSFVIMESWLMGKPVMVSAACEVTKNFCRESNGGLWFEDFFEFEGVLNYLRANKDIADSMGAMGKKFVRDSFAWDKIVEKYLSFLDKQMTLHN